MFYVEKLAHGRWLVVQPHANRIDADRQVEWFASEGIRARVTMRGAS